MSTKSKSKIDYPLLLIILSLLAYGFIALYSASTVESYKNFGNTTYYIFRQILYGGGMGLVLMWLFARIDYHKWRKLLPIMLGATLLLLALVKAPGLGFSAGGATRWIHIGPVFFQPSEFAKLVVILYLAAWSAKSGKQINESFVFHTLPALVVVGLLAGLILWQPDFGTMGVIIATAVVILFASGVSLKRFMTMLLGAGIVLFLLIKFEPYRYQRLLTLLNPTADPQGAGYQLNQALLAIGAGGLWGYGYGLSRQKYNYLPEPMTDSIFAIAAEELGFVRVTILLLLFVLLLFRSLRVARQAPDAFGKIIALGIAIWISLQAAINIGSMLGLLPLTGVPLPFFSYGSSSLVITLAAMGILLNISRQARG